MNAQILAPRQDVSKLPWLAIAAICLAFIVRAAWQWFSPQMVLSAEFLASLEGVHITQTAHKLSVGFIGSALFTSAYLLAVPRAAPLLCAAMVLMVLSLSEFGLAFRGDPSFWYGSFVPLVLFLAALLLSLQTRHRQGRAHGI